MTKGVSSCTRTSPVASVGVRHVFKLIRAKCCHGNSHSPRWRSAVVSLERSPLSGPRHPSHRGPGAGQPRSHTSHRIVGGAHRSPFPIKPSGPSIISFSRAPSVINSPASQTPLPTFHSALTHTRRRYKPAKWIASRRFVFPTPQARDPTRMPML